MKTQWLMTGMAGLMALMTLGCNSGAQKLEAKQEQAINAARSWLHLVDTWDYNASWEQTSKSFKQDKSKKEWVKQMGRARSPLGGALVRKLKDAQYRTYLPGQPKGQFFVIRFDTVFDNQPRAVETVKIMRETNGAWRVIGYFIR